MPLKIYIDMHVFSNTLRLIVVVYLMDTLYVHVYFKYGSLYELVYTIISCFLVTFVVVQYGAPGLFVFFCASSVWVKFRSLFGTDMHVSIYNLSPWVSDCGNVSIQGTCICLFSFEETGTYSYRYNLVDIFYVG